MTDAQRRALYWLPSGGTWRSNAGRLVTALNSLRLAYPGHVEGEWADCGPRGGREMRWRLTHAGITFKFD